MPFKLPMILGTLLMWLQTCQPQLPPTPAVPPLPVGSSYAQARAWLASHPFFEAEPIGPLGGMNYWSLIAYRRLEGDQFLDLVLRFDEAQAGAAATQDPPLGELAEAELSLVQRRPDPGKDPDSNWDPRPWQDVAYLNPWSQSDARGLGLLASAFGPALAEDYRRARVLYDGPEYVLAEPTEYYRKKIGILSYQVYAWSDRVMLFEGQTSGYEVNAYGQAEKKGTAVSFMPISREWARESAEILKHNQGRYEAYLKQGGPDPESDE